MIETDTDDHLQLYKMCDKESQEGLQRQTAMNATKIVSVKRDSKVTAGD